MAPLPHRDLRHPWHRYKVEGYTEDIVQKFNRRLETIWDSSVNRVHILAFKDLTPEIRQDLTVRLRMVYAGGRGATNICEMSDTEMGLDTPNTLYFQLGGARHRMTWRLFIMAMGLHTVEEMGQAGFEVYWGSSLLCSYQRPREEIMPQDDSMQHFWLSGGHFIGRLALPRDEGLMGLTPSAAADALEAAEDALIDDEGARADPAPAQAPPPPPAP
ncbi:hypothetical protein Tco_1501608 [Tanacetum coccineum]